MVSSSNIQLSNFAGMVDAFSVGELTQQMPDTPRVEGIDPLQTSTGVYVTVHGHFYQPPRENPYLDTIEHQPSAAPFHDWNERIYHECYRPNAFARIFNDHGEVVAIVNNFEFLSFNIGPTLMSWLHRYDPLVYERIVLADQKSCQRLGGHGNGIAQAYNHIILPLANEQDKHTQILWGKEDFRWRFGREPEGMWLAETAVDYATLEALVAQGIRFIILAPSQAQRCRPFPTEDDPQPEWHEVGGSQIDPTRPYRCYLKGPQIEGETVEVPVTPEMAYVDVFFYDGPISRDMGFSDVLMSAHCLAGRLGQAVRGDHRPSQLISVATDGETFGHHKKGGDKCLAYAFLEEFPRRGWTVTNYAHYLSINPPTWEVELKPVTAWSCAHGVDRWQDDCGCGAAEDWHLKWRRPLRDALDWLRDQLIPIYEDLGQKLFTDPWAARDGYIQVILDRSAESVNQFFSEYQSHPLTDIEKVDALRLLEMQRHTLLMYTSCGWFFEELSRPEGTQILRYAARALELAGDVAGVKLAPEFIERLALAPSNVETYRTGDEVYRQLVITAQISLSQVAADYAISSLFTTYNRQERLYCYNIEQLDYQLQRMGSLTLALGQVELVSEITWESQHLVFAVLHLGGWDFHCCIQPFGGRRAYVELKEKLFTALQQASAAHIILVMVQLFGDEAFSLRDLFSDERHRMMTLLTQETLIRLDQLYTQVYRDNYGVIAGFQRDELPVPQELQVAVEIALSHRCLAVVRALETDVQNHHSNGFINRLLELEAVVAEAENLRCQLKITEVKDTLEQVIQIKVQELLYGEDFGDLEEAIDSIDRMINIGERLNLELYLEPVQELYFYALQTQLGPLCWAWNQGTQEGEETRWNRVQLHQLLHFGKMLKVDVHRYLELIHH